MKTRPASPTTILAFALAVAAMLNGCLGTRATTPNGNPPTAIFPPGTSLPFETIMISDEYQPQGGSFDPWIEVVISDRQSAISGIPPEAQTKISGVDFSKFFVIFVSRGLASPRSGIRVQSIRQSSDEVYVITWFTSPPATTVPRSTSPFHVVKVRKDSLTFRGKISFWLLDESGKRRSVRTGTISAPWTLPPGTDLPFENIWIANDMDSRGKPRDPKIEVIAAGPHDATAGVPTNAQVEIDRVDFSKYLVVVVFRGLAGPDFPVTVETIRQTGNVIYVVAWFDPGPRVSVPIDSFPFHIVKVNKGLLTSRGSITFKLLDEESGQERANVTVTVS